jgi:glutathione S-transferase
MKAGLPFGQLPVLEVDGVKLGQSNACARYLARKFNLAGKTDFEQAQVDMIVDCFEDTGKPMMTIFHEKDETKKAELKKKYAEEQLPAHLTLLEKLLTANHGGDKFFVGTELTWADIQFLTLSKWISFFAGIETPYAKFPKLAALKTRVESVPKIANWIEKRPKTAM